MRIVFIGTVEHSLQMLKVIIGEKMKIVGILTADDNGDNSDYADLGPVASHNKIPIMRTRDINSHKVINWIQELSPNVIFCIGWSRLIDKKILQIPSIGVIGYHPAALPLNRGRHPLIWALVLGLKRTSSTFFFMDESADTGDIIDQRQIAINQDDDASTLYKKMVKVARKQIKDILPSLIDGNYNRISQNNLESNVWRKRDNKDGQIDWRMSATSIYNLVRGLTKPYVGAHFVTEGKEYKVWKSRVVSCINTDNVEPGKVIDVNRDRIPCIMCGDDCIELLEVDPVLSTSKGSYL